MRSWLVGVLALCAVRTAHADKAEADRLVDEATTLAKDGNFLDAAAKFRDAFAADPRPELVCNIGIAYFKTEKQLPRAQLFLSQCLTRGTMLDGQFVKAVREVLEAVEGQLRNGDFTPIDVVVKPDGASVLIEGFARDEAFVGSRLVWLPFGTHALIVRADGHVEQKRPVEATSRQQRTVQVSLERVKQPDPIKIDPKPEPKPDPPRDRRPSKLERYWAPSLASVVSVGLGGFALGQYLEARKHADAANAARTGPRFADESERASSTRTQAVLLAIGSGAVGALSGYLWYRALRTPKRIEVSATPRHVVASLAIEF